MDSRPNAYTLDAASSSRQRVLYRSVSCALCFISVAYAEEARKKYDWDFSVSHWIGQVPWPTGSSSGDILYHLEPMEKVHLQVTKNESFERYTELITFCRHEKELAYVQLRFEDQTLEDTYNTALELAKKWNFPVEKLDEWKRAVLSGKYATLLLADHQRIPSIDIEIFKSFDTAKPFVIDFTIGWPTP